VSGPFGRLVSITNKPNHFSGSHDGGGRWKGCQLGGIILKPSKTNRNRVRAILGGVYSIIKKGLGCTTVWVHGGLQPGEKGLRGR